MAESQRVLVTGSRTWTDRETVCAALEEATFAAFDRGQRSTVVHGGAGRGADAIAANWCAEKIHAGWPVDVERHPADWRKYHQRAGLIRNTVMVDLGADLCLAFISPCPGPPCERPQPHGSHGATHCAELARKAGIRTIVFAGVR